MFENQSLQDPRMAPNITSQLQKSSIFIDMNEETETTKLEADYTKDLNEIRVELSESLKNMKEMNLMPGKLF